MSAQRGWWMLALASTIACASRPVLDAHVDDDGSGGDGSGDVSCETVFDPSTFADGPIVEPDGVNASAECPALTGPLALELPQPVLVTGSLELGGVPTEAHARFVGRGDEGEIETTSAAPTFAFELLPGRYDIYAWLPTTMLEHYVLVGEDIELGESTQLVLDVPPRASAPCKIGRRFSTSRSISRNSTSSWPSRDTGT